MAATGATKLDVVDGLRGAAVLAVILFHHGMETQRTGGSLFRSLTAPARFGWAGVHLFLVLSGFCLTYSLWTRSDRGQVVGLGRYLLDRWRRIAPAYYAAIALYLGFEVVLKQLGHRPYRRFDTIDFGQIAAHLGFVHGLWRDRAVAINSPFWSLSLEFQFYVALPLIFEAARRFGAAGVAAVLAAGSLAWRIGILLALPEAAHLLNGFFPGRVAEFGFGVALALRVVRGDGDGASIAARPRWAGPALVALGLALPGPARAIASDLIIGLGWSLVLAWALASAGEGGRMGRFLSSRPLVAIGAVSYSLYLTHGLALAVVDRNLAVPLSRLGLIGDLTLFLAAAAMVAAVGSLFYRGIERRSLRSVDARPAGRHPTLPALIPRPHIGLDPREPRPTPAGRSPREGRLPRRVGVR
jgi:peptidoglycan/LPS O-acetylase OafA/YrhL